MTQDQITTGVVAVLTFLFAGFLLYITRSATGDLSTAAVALVGPLVGAVVASFFHAAATATGAAISSTGAAAGAAAASGQSTTVKMASGQETGVTIGQRAAPFPVG